MTENDKPIPVKDIEKQQSEVDLSQHLINNGEFYYIAKKLDKQVFIDSVFAKIKDELKFEASHIVSEGIHIIKYKGKGGISGSLGFTATFHLFFMFDNDKLLLDIKSEKWFETGEEKFAIGQLFRTSKYNEIKKFIANYILANTISDEYSCKIDENNRYINKISDKKKLWFCANSEENEILLAFLQLSSQRGNSDDVNQDKDLVWYFMLSSQCVKLVAFNKREEVVQEFDCEVDSFKVNKEIGRNRLVCNDKTFLCPRSNNKVFYELSQADLSSSILKIREIARLNWLNTDTDSDETPLLVLELLKFLVHEHHLLEDELSILYLEYLQKNKDELFALFANNNSLLQLLDKILVSEKTSEWLENWVEKWQVSYVDVSAINDLLLSSVDNALQANNLLEFHRFVREKFFHNDKDKINRIWFDIGFCKHLIKSGLLSEAKKILTKNLKKLPDENMSDLLPGKEIDLTASSAAGQIIKVKILELLIDIDSEKNAISHKIKLACLQPLVEMRIDELIKVSEDELSQKGKILKSIMLPEGLKTEKTANIPLCNERIEAKLLDKYVRHPLNKKGGNLTKFQKWVATVKTQDYSILKSYAEVLNPEVHNELNTIIRDIANALKINTLDVFIARGEKSFGISSFEGEPNFLLIGANHLDENSPHYLQPLELRYAIAGELAHLYFKHARITSNDIWRGAIDKGNIILEAISAFVPAVGLFGKSMQGIGKLNSISSFLQKTGKAGKISDTSRNILLASDQLMKIYQSKKEKSEIDKEKEFWATARVIQATSDRCALIFTKNIKEAVRSILMTSKSYNTEIQKIDEIGLRNYLLETNEDGEFLHQELAIRLSNLFSFYLSKDYKGIISKINFENYTPENQ